MCIRDRHEILAVLVVHHDNNASNMVVEKVGTLRVIVVAEVQRCV